MRHENKPITNGKKDGFFGASRALIELIYLYLVAPKLRLLLDIDEVWTNRLQSDKMHSEVLIIPITSSVFEF